MDVMNADRWKHGTIGVHPVHPPYLRFPSGIYHCVPSPHPMIVVYILLGIIALILILAAMKPNTLNYNRSAVINAPAEKIFPLINDFHEWPKWSPWEKLDPNMKRTHTGSPSGKGAHYAWVGSKKVGEGSMEIMDTKAPNDINIKIDFLKPWEAHNNIVFRLQPQGGGTHVDWRMSGPSNFMAKVFSVFVNMDKLVGKDFETGLASMKAEAEK